LHAKKVLDVEKQIESHNTPSWLPGGKVRLLVCGCLGSPVVSISVRIAAIAVAPNFFLAQLAIRYSQNRIRFGAADKET